MEELKAFVNEKMSIPFEQMLFVCRGSPCFCGDDLARANDLTMWSCNTLNDT